MSSGRGSGRRRRRSLPRPTPPQRSSTSSTPPPMALQVEAATPPEAEEMAGLSPQELVVAVRNTLDPLNPDLASLLRAEGSQSVDMVNRYGCFASEIINILSARAAQLSVDDEAESRLSRLKRALRKASRSMSPFCRGTRRRGVLGRARSVVRRLTRRQRPPPYGQNRRTTRRQPSPS